MRVHRYREGVNLALDQPSVVTIGNFDGIHLGHQFVIEQAIDRAHEFNLTSVLVFFDPQPLEFFKGDQVPARLTRTREKIDLLSETGIEHVVIVRFNQAMADMPAEAFVNEFLVNQLQVKNLIVGNDFKFGYRRQGNVELLRTIGEQQGFAVESCEDFQLDGERVSSSRVRHALEHGNLQEAKHLLGRYYSLSGKVCHGHKRGRQIGFPTANIFLHRTKSPVLGIYAVRMQGLGEEPVAGVANIGTRPTVGGTRILLEVYLFNFNRNIYGYHVSVDILHKIRDEVYFESLEALREQIVKDVEDAKAYFFIPSP